ncbi:MAG: selenium cofactor biosynthesis protein YqeC [Treponema sp.]|nr:selenium cofactor biosynthesis protein YqeC [Treponema sp.]
MTLPEYLGIGEGSAAAVVGCGGKTSLIELVAAMLPGKKVLVSPTAKMFPIKAGNVTLCETLRQCGEHEPQAGIQCLGILNAATGKLEALPEKTLASLIPRYDAALLEADGSRGLPCKGWLANEPVVPPFCTHTIGIVTMNPLGMPATEKNVHRLPEFLSLTGLGPGEAITEQALEAMACSPRGMFKNSVGLKYLIVNQVEDEGAASAAVSFLVAIKEKHPGYFERLLYGSVRLNQWQEV